MGAGTWNRRGKLTYFAENTEQNAPGWFAKLLKDHDVKTRGRAIDLACGAGRYTLELLRWGLEVISVDIEFQALELLRKRCHPYSTTTISHDISRLDFEKNYFEVALAMDCFQFLTRTDVCRVVSRMQSWLHSRGIMILQFRGCKDQTVGRCSLCKTWTREDVEGLFSALPGYMLLKFFETESDKKMLGDRETIHTHILTFVWRKVY